MAIFVALIELGTGLTVYANPEEVEVLSNIPTDLGGPGTYIQQVQTSGRLPVPGLLAVTGAPAAVRATLIAASPTTALVALVALDTGLTVYVNPASVESLSPVPVDLGGPGTYIHQADGTGDVPVPQQLAVQGAVAAVAAALTIAPPVEPAIGFASVCYVDPAGSDVTGVRGSLQLRFATIAAAIAAAQSGDSIQLAPGIYAQAAPLVIPITLTQLSIIGPDQNGAVLTFDPASNGVQCPDGSGVLAFENFSIVVDANRLALEVVSTTGTTPGFVLRNMVLTAGVGGTSFQGAGLVDFQMENVIANQGILLDSCTGVMREGRAEGLTIGRIPAALYDAGTGYVTLDGTIVTQLSLVDAAQVHALASAWVRFAVIAQFLANTGAVGPHIMLECSLGDPEDPIMVGDLDFSTLPPRLAAEPRYILRCTGLAPGANWTFGQLAGLGNVPDLDGSRPRSGTTITVTGVCALSLRGVPTQELTLVAGGAGNYIDRDFVVILGAAMIIGPATVPIAPGLPNVFYSVTALGNVAGMDLRNPIRGLDTFDLTSSAIGTADIVLTRST
jgi:hypothetical protein